jgi:ribosomal protein S18 acetylase RimI-like enzyme
MPFTGSVLTVSRRQATDGDRELVRSIHHRAYRNVIERQYGVWDIAHQDQFFEVAWRAANHEIILCDGVCCGYCSVDNRSDEILIRELVIDPEYQCLGIGTLILQGVFNDSNARGVPVRLQTQTLNRAAGLYRRLGFLETKRTETHILMERDPAKDAG